MIQQHGLPDVLAKAMLARGVNPDDFSSYVSPKLASNLPDPSLIADMDRAADRIAAAIIKGEHIFVYGDYDVDGATSTSLIYMFLKDAGAKQVSVRIPERNEGYDADSESMKEAWNAGASLVITVDCGTTAFEAIETAKELGMDVVVIDHHEQAEHLPPADAIVNPKVAGQSREGPFLHLAAVGVVFMVTIAVSRALRNFGWYDQRKEPDLKQYLDLVALGTVCDVVKLIGVNRLFVKAGTLIASQNTRVGLKVLSQILNITQPLSTYHFGFVIGPRINAGGRVGPSSLGFRLLTAVSEAEALSVAKELDELNLKRREIEAAVMYQTINQIEAQDLGDAKFIMAIGDNWQQGVVGIVAGRLRERYGLPSLVVTVEDGKAKGSGRSIDGIDLGSIIIAAAKEGIITDGGGHSMAVGFSFDIANADKFRQFLDKSIQQQLNGEDIQQTIEYDAIVAARAVNLKTASQLKALEPYGAGNEEPAFVIQNALVNNATIVGSGHVRCVIKGVDGGSVRAIAFRAADSALGKVLLENRGEPLHIMGKMRLDNWNQRETVTFNILDIARA